MWRLDRSLFDMMWSRRSKCGGKTNNFELQEGRSLMRSPSQESDNKSQGRSTTGSNYRRAHRALYLGHVPVSMATGLSCTEEAVTWLLDRAALATTESDDSEYVFIDVSPFSLFFHRVDESCKVTDTVTFNVARISYCSGDLPVDPCVFAWIYHQESQLECHAVRVKSTRRAHLLALQLQKAFCALYKDVQAALESSKLFHAALSTATSGEAAANLDQTDGSIIGNTPCGKETVVAMLGEEDPQNMEEGSGREQTQIVEVELDLCYNDLPTLPKPDLISHPLSHECRLYP